MNVRLADEPLLDRRALLMATGCLALAGAVSWAAPRAWTRAPSTVSAGSPLAMELNDVRYVVTDRRYAQSLDFARSAGLSGAPSLEVTDGLTRLWQERLVPLWDQPDGAVVGLTTRDVWHCLAEQARGQRRLGRLLSGGTDASPSLVAWIIT